MRRIFFAVVSGAILAAAAARADEGVYRDHMAAAAKLLEDENQAAARAEFEAAYRAEARGGALVGAALCDRALFRYPQAIATLERALRDHAGTLDEGERKTAAEALADLKAQLGFVQVMLSPPGAALRIDGEDQPAGAAQRLIPLAPGSHRLEARLDGMTPAGQTITLASGETAAIKLRLVPLGSAGPEVAKGSGRGPYVMGAVSGFVPLPPSDFSGTGAGVSVGARVGYRFAAIMGAEVGFEYAYAGASGMGKPSFSDKAGATFPISYAHSSFRFGASVRLMTTGARVRFVQILGGGGMMDALSWEPGAGTPPRQNAVGGNGFALSETGFEFDIRGGLLGLVIQQVVGSGGGLTHPKHDAYTAQTFGGPQYAIGLGLRGGYRLF